MNENLNLVELLKDCPKGTKLYSTIYGDVCFEKIDLSNGFPIKFTQSDDCSGSVTTKGKHLESNNGECTLFPSKDQRDWSKWHKPFKDGDIITCTNNLYSFVAIYKEIVRPLHFREYCSLILDWNKFSSNIRISDFIKPRLATEDEKQKFFDAIKEHGYRWNADTKTLEEIADVKESRFHPKTLEPFDKVLVKLYERMPWCVDFYSYYDEDNDYVVCTGEIHYDYCIPYNEETKHLTGTVEDAPVFYRYWED